MTDARTIRPEGRRRRLDPAERPPLPPPGPQLPPRRAPLAVPPVYLLTPLPARHFMMRARRDGPLVPARLWFCNHEPEVPDNLLDRGRLSVYPRADIGGLEVDPEHLFGRLMSHTDLRPAYAVTHWRYVASVSEAEYSHQLRVLRWAERNRPDDPTLQPRRAVDMAQLPLPDFTRENEL